MVCEISRFQKMNRTFLRFFVIQQKQEKSAKIQNISLLFSLKSGDCTRKVSTDTDWLGDAAGDNWRFTGKSGALPFKSLN